MDKMFVQVNVEDKEVKDNDGFIFCGHSDSCGSIEGLSAVYPLVYVKSGDISFIIISPDFSDWREK